MKNLRTIIGVLLISLIIIVIILIAIINKNNSNEEILKDADIKDIIKTNVHKVENRTDFYAVSNCVNKYLTYLTINLNNNEHELQQGDTNYAPDEFALSMGVKTQEDKNKLIYNILDTTFIEKNKITTKNIYNFIEERKGKLGFEAEKINVLEGEEVETYCAYGRIYDISTLETIDYGYYIVSIDRYKITFMIEPLKNDYDNIDEIALERRVDVIEENGVNDVRYETVSDLDMALKYFTHYKTNAVNNTEHQYEYLDYEYRDKRFKNLNNYRTYIKQNSEEISSAQMVGYEVDKTNSDYTQFICQDDKGRYYIFKETAPMQYTVLLDTYTIDVPQFIEKYDKCNPQEKVILNIEKTKQALNLDDYTYVYSKLADSFKNNKYKTEQEFEKYIKGVLYNNIEIEYKDFSNEGEIYIYDIEIKNLDNEEDEIINMQIIMQLKEERDFVMSFSIKE